VRTGLWRRTTHRARRGQSFVLVALFMVVLMGGAAASITVGSVYFAQTRLQNAVDAAALAGAQNEADNYPTTANESTLQQKNMPGATIEVTSLAPDPSTGQQDRVKAIGTVQVPGGFASIFGIKTFTVRVAGVAAYEPLGPFGDALFQGARQPLTVRGNTTVNGSAHSNGSITIGGSSCVTGGITAGAPGSSAGGGEGCTASVSQIPYVDMPSWTLAQVTPQNATVLQGSQCSSIPNPLVGNYILDCNLDESGQLTIDGNVLLEPGYSVDIGGGVVISGSLIVDSGSVQIHGGMSQGVAGQAAALADLNGNIEIEGNDAIDGTVYSPQGTIELKGTQAINGAVVGLNVTLDGNKDITYSPPPTGPSDLFYQVVLVQ
jgi:hypothetical protein